MNTFLPESQLLVLVTRLHVSIEVTMKLTGNKIFPYFDHHSIFGCLLQKNEAVIKTKLFFPS